jgi:large subunit ribosomal protein L9
MLTDLTLEFTAKAGETDKLYGSITSQMIVDEIQEKLGAELNRRQVDHEPIRMLGEHSVRIRLTMDLIPEIKVNVLREGEIPGEAVEEPTEEEASDAIEETPAAEEATVLEEPETEEAEVSAEESTEESAPVDEVEEAADSETPAEIVDEAPAETEAETEE